MDKKITLLIALYAGVSWGQPYYADGSGACKTGAYLTRMYGAYARVGPQPLIPAGIAGQRMCGTYNFKYLDPYSYTIKNGRTTVEVAEFLDVHDSTCRRCR